MRRPILFIAAVMAVVAIGCSSTPPSATPVPSASPAGSPAAPAPSAVPPASPSAAPSEGPSAQPPASPSAAPVVFTAAQQRLVDALRSDSRINCAPRTTDLPPGAVAGVECSIDSALVERVGVYGFGEGFGVARDAYLARIRAAKVTPGTGNCTAGLPGDASYPTNLPDTGDDGGLSALRSGCFLDAGYANVRLTCYDEIYMGVLGKTADLAALYEWSWKVKAGDSVDRDPPGLCDRPD